MKIIKGCHSFQFNLKKGDRIPYLKNGIDRYGYAIFRENSREGLFESFEKCKYLLNQEIIIEADERN